MRKLIVIEGLDGSGKATQAQLLYNALKERDFDARKISFPNYDSPSSSLVKMYLGGDFGTHPNDVNAYAASSFYAVDRYASFKKDWYKDWVQGIVIADRYTTSNAIHQCSKLPKDKWDSYLDWLFNYEYVLLGIPKPEFVIYLRVDPEVSQRLMTGRYEGKEEKKDIHEKDLEYLRNCQVAADYCSKRLEWIVVECCKNDEMRSIEDIQNDIQSIINSLLS